MKKQARSKANKATERREIDGRTDRDGPMRVFRVFFQLKRDKGTSKIQVQHDMLRNHNQRRRAQGRRKKHSNVSTLSAIVFWALASLLCLSILCWISYQVSSAEQEQAATLPLRREPESKSVQVDAENVVFSTRRDFRFRPLQTVVECTISTPHSTNPKVANGKFHIVVRSDLAPKASEAFLPLVRANYYSGTYFHRVVKNFVAQVGINSNYHIMRPPGPKETVPDPVLPSSLSNVRGTVSFAGGNMRLGQIFINLGNNQKLDNDNGGDGSTRPFGMVSQAKEDDMELIDKIYTGYKEGSGLVKAVKNGQVAAQFPEMSRIQECHVIENL